MHPSKETKQKKHILLGTPSLFGLYFLLWIPAYIYSTNNHWLVEFFTQNKTIIFLLFLSPLLTFLLPKDRRYIILSNIVKVQVFLTIALVTRFYEWAIMDGISNLHLDKVSVAVFTGVISVLLAGYFILPKKKRPNIVKMFKEDHEYKNAENLEKKRLKVDAYIKSNPRRLFWHKFVIVVLVLFFLLLLYPELQCFFFSEMCDFYKI